MGYNGTIEKINFFNNWQDVVVDELKMTTMCQSGYFAFGTILGKQKLVHIVHLVEVAH
jgi:hypothetical protein